MKVYNSVVLAVLAVLAVSCSYVAADNAFGTNVAATLDPKTRALELFVRGRGNALYHTTLAFGGGDGLKWKSTEWHEHGGSAATSHPVAVVNSRGMTAVYARGAKNRLHGVKQMARQKGFESSWSRWSELGPKKPMASLPVACTMNDGRVALLSISPANKVQFTVETYKGMNVFGEWVELGSLPVHTRGMPQFVRPPKGNLHVYVVGDDYNIYSIAAKGPTQSFAHSNWKVFDGPKTDLGENRELIMPFGNVEQMVAAANSDGRQEVFAKTTGNVLVHRREKLPGTSQWTPWRKFGQRRFPGTLTVYEDPALSIIRLFGRGVDSQVWMKQQDRSTGWTSWLTIGGSVRFTPEVVNDGRGGTHVFAVGIDNVVSHKVLTAGRASQWLSLPGVLAM
eukprot:TRINITY_DN15162_c0_g1_i1.p1 TRINITY_DN15162_c0_g1~~TRINITY_DN15162_c0_g1_i1.p1  ORF type:complete len:394 (-),score=92.13 TRINITY_DN15162_c0_g1_i1:199-1380(-)